MSILYSIVVHRGFNLPKADSFGKIDPYCVVYFDGNKIGKTKIIDSNYNPVWKAYFTVFSDNMTPKISLKLKDHDTLSKDDFCGDITIPLDSVPCCKKKFVVENVPASMVHSKENPEIVISVGRCLSYEQTKARFGAFQGVLFDDKKHQLVIPVAAGVPVYFSVEYENLNKKNSQVDLEMALLITDRNYLDQAYLDFAWAGKKYKIKKYSNESKKSLGKCCGIEYYARIAVPDMKIHNLIFCTNLFIRWGVVAERHIETINDVSSAHGWKGSLTYPQAKATLHNCTFDDDHGYVYMDSTYGTVLVDYDKGNCDFSYLLPTSLVQSGYVPDYTCAKESKRTIQFVPQGIVKNSKSYMMKASIDDLPFGTLFKTMFIETCRIQINNMVPIFSLFPIATF